MKCWGPFALWTTRAMPSGSTNSIQAPSACSPLVEAMPGAVARSRTRSAAAAVGGFHDDRVLPPEVGAAGGAVAPPQRDHRARVEVGEGAAGDRVLVPELTTTTPVMSWVAALVLMGCSRVVMAAPGDSRWFGHIDVKLPGADNRYVTVRVSSSFVPLSQPDVLSSVLREVRLESASYRRLELTAPWRLRFDGGLRGVHVLVSGRCTITLDAGPATTLEVGDLVMLPRADSHQMSSVGDEQGPAASSLELARRTTGSDVPCRRVCPDRPPPPGSPTRWGTRRCATSPSAGCTAP